MGGELTLQRLIARVQCVRVGGDDVGPRPHRRRLFRRENLQRAGTLGSNLRQPRFDLPDLAIYTDGFLANDRLPLEIGQLLFQRLFLCIRAPLQQFTHAAVVLSGRNLTRRELRAQQLRAGGDLGLFGHQVVFVTLQPSCARCRSSAAASFLLLGILLLDSSDSCSAPLLDLLHIFDQASSFGLASDLLRLTIDPRDLVLLLLLFARLRLGDGIGTLQEIYARILCGFHLGVLTLLDQVGGQRLDLVRPVLDRLLHSSQGDGIPRQRQAALITGCQGVQLCQLALILRQKVLHLRRGRPEANARLHRGPCTGGFHPQVLESTDHRVLAGANLGQGHHRFIGSSTGDHRHRILVSALLLQRLDLLVQSHGHEVDLLVELLRALDRILCQLGVEGDGVFQRLPANLPHSHSRVGHGLQVLCGDLAVGPDRLRRLGASTGRHLQRVTGLPGHIDQRQRRRGRLIARQHQGLRVGLRLLLCVVPREHHQADGRSGNRVGVDHVQQCRRDAFQRRRDATKAVLDLAALLHQHGEERHATLQAGENVGELSRQLPHRLRGLAGRDAQITDVVLRRQRASSLGAHLAQLAGEHAQALPDVGQVRTDTDAQIR